MSDPVIHLKPGDTVSRIVLHLKDRRTGLPYDLTNGTTFNLKYEGVATGIRTMTIDGTPSLGALAYQVQASDFVKTGIVTAQAEVIDGASKVITSDNVPILISHKVTGT